MDDRDQRRPRVLIQRLPRKLIFFLLPWVLWIAVARAQALADPPKASEAKRPDVVLITIDTLRADALGFAGNDTIATPILDRLAREGRVFPRAHAHNVVTLPSHANILTGLYPYQHGIRDNEGYRLDASIPTLATVLREAGYTTAAFVSAYPLDGIFGLDRGFDVYDDRTSKGGTEDQFSLAERRGQETVAEALSWWGATEGPRFLWLHLYDPHAPYDAPEPFAGRYPDTPYLAEVAATDHYLSPLLTPFFEKRRGAPLVIMTSDHGEALGDHGELTHGLFAYEATLAVPLVIWGPGVEAGSDDRPARHIDLFATILDALDLPMPSSVASLHDGTHHGRSLLAPAEDATSTYFEALSASLNRGWAPLYGLIEDHHKLIVLPIPELYDLPSDPAEQHNLVRRERRRAADLRDALPDRSQIWPSDGDRASSAAASQKLQSLGYLGGDAEVRQSYGPEDDPKNLVDLDRRLHEAIDLYSRGQLEAALAHTQDIIRQRPSMGLGQSLHAQTLLQSGRRQEALRAMLAARDLGAANPPLLRQLGLTLSEAGRHEEALAQLRPLAEDGDPRNRQALALALSEAGRQDEAKALLDALRRQDPEDATTFEQLSLVALRQERWQEAEQLARRAITLDTSLPRPHNNLGVALARRGDMAGAVDAWQRAVDLDPSLYDALYNLGTQALALKRHQQARTALERFIESAPEAAYAADLRRARVLLRRLERQSNPS